ncbi:hypothetical protein [Paraburkholderia guartelaensis]|uniref:Uncharacterized protein n=1 Tax=Paraburkholderia guartelaensis TaxID=2546446 RepID=A0ABU9SB22_9BURK
MQMKNPRSLKLSRVSGIQRHSLEQQHLVPGTGLEPASRKAADFRHTTSFDAARHAWARVRALDYAFTVAERRVISRRAWP